MSVNSIGGFRYFVKCIDDYTRHTYVYFIKHKDEVLAKFKEFVDLVTNLTGKSVKTLRTDTMEASFVRRNLSHSLKRKELYVS
jgi:hypothetical protein